MKKCTKIITISIKLLYYSFNIVQYYWLTDLVCYGVICSGKTEESLGVAGEGGWAPNVKNLLVDIFKR